MTHNEDFETFWRSFPRRTGKLAAMREYEKARFMASAEDILAGVERYKKNKPDYADWCHPRTFLYQGRWMDEEDAQPEVVIKEYWADVCQREHGGNCRNRWDHEMKLREAS